MVTVLGEPVAPEAGRDGASRRSDPEVAAVLPRVSSILIISDSDDGSSQSTPRSTSKTVRFDLDGVTEFSPAVQPKAEKLQRSGTGGLDHFAVALFLALLCLSCFGLAEFSVLVVTWNADAPCQRPLRTFIIGAMVFTVSCTVLVSLHRQLCKVWNRWPEATRKTLSWVASILSHMWFGMGSFFVFFANHCAGTSPHLFNFSVVLTSLFLLVVAGEVVVGLSSVFDSTKRSRMVTLQS